MGILRSDRITGLGGANAITGSVQFFGSNYISVGKSSDFALGTGDWTVEYWAHQSSEVAYQRHFYLIGSSSSNIDGIFADGSGISFGRTNVWAPTQVTHVDERWNHYALVHDSTNMRLYINGTQVLTSTDNFGTDSEKELIIGYSNSTFGGNFDGYISNFRIENGFARYTSAFTPSNTRLTKTENTTFLGLQSSSNVLQEETGKVIVLNRSTTDSTGPIASRFTPNSPVGFSTTSDVGSQYGATFDGFTVLATSTYMVPPGGNTRERNRGRGFFMVGYANPNQVDDIDYLNIQSLGNTISFGSLTTGKYSMGAGASSTRGIFCGGYQGGASPDTDINAIEFITIASEGNATDFGDRTVVGRSIAAASSSTRCVMASGLTGAGIQNTIDLVEFATAANAIDFGDLLAATNDMCNACNSPTRGIFSGGNTPSSPHRQNVMQFVTMASTGDATDYGDLTEAGRSSYGGTASSNTRGLILIATGDHSNVINFTTIATTGNAANFGDLFTGRYAAGSCSDSTRAVFLAGRTPSYINTMDTVTIATTGNAIDFGDVSGASGGSAFGAAGSDSHGGLS